MSKLPILCGDRETSPRPCPHTTCRYHLSSVKDPRGRKSTVARDESETCALDVAEEGGHTLKDVGLLVGLTRERVRQIEVRALKKLRVVARRFDLNLDNIVAPGRHALDIGDRSEGMNGGRDIAKLRATRRRYYDKINAAKKAAKA